MKHAATTAVAAADAITAATTADVAFIEESGTAPTLSERSLWLRGAPAPDSLLEHWQVLKTDLAGADEEGWEVWIQWYEDRLAGRPSNQNLEVAKVLIPDEIWEQGPKVLNAEIARLIDEHAERALPLTRSLSISSAGEIEAVEAVPRENIPGDLDQRDLVGGICDRLLRQIRHLRGRPWNQFKVLERWVLEMEGHCQVDRPLFGL